MAPQERSVTMTESEVRQLITTTVHDTLTILGIEHKEPLEMQKDFQHLREWRQSSDAIKRKGVMTLVGIAVAAICGAIMVGVKAYFR